MRVTYVDPGKNHTHEDEENVETKQSVEQITNERTHCVSDQAPENSIERHGNGGHDLQRKPAQQNRRQYGNQRRILRINTRAHKSAAHWTDEWICEAANSLRTPTKRVRVCQICN